MEFVGPYQPTLWAMGAIGFLLLLQLIIADLVSIKSRHKPGHPVPPDSSKFLFRSARAHANTNESISAFGLFAIVGILSSADPVWLNGFAWVYIGSRLVHMASYYANIKLPRSIAFGVSLVALLGMFAASLAEWLA